MLRPKPFIGAYDDGPFWEGCRKGELRLQRCRASGRFIWPILPFCPDDLREMEWVRVSGEGTVSAYVVYRRIYHPEFTDTVPYIVANVELAEGARMSGNIFGSDGEVNADRILGDHPPVNALNDRKVRVFFEDCGEGLIIPQWKLLA